MSLTYRHDADGVERPARSPQPRRLPLRDVRELIDRRASTQEQFEFAAEHPIIRTWRNTVSWFIRHSTRVNMDERLRTMLRKLRLSGLAQSLDVRLQEAAGHA